MSKSKKSGPAIFMYCVIALTAGLACACFTLHYGRFFESRAVLLTGVVAFTVMYHLWVRLLLGNVSKLFRISHRQRWFRQRSFEAPLYHTLGVKKWKERALTYNPELFSLRERSLEQIADTMAKVEVDHWMNVAISLSTLLFAIPWGMFWAFLVSALAAIVFDGQFIAIQRYNRPRVVRVLEKRNAAEAAPAAAGRP